MPSNITPAFRPQRKQSKLQKAKSKLSALVSRVVKRRTRSQVLTVLGIIAVLPMAVTAVAHGLTVFLPSQGGTGTGVTPQYGQVLMGNGQGVYTPVSTSSLGIISSNLDVGFSTSSADYWKSVTSFFSTTSAQYFESTFSRWATTSASYFLSQNQSAAFSTSSALYWDSTQLRWATTSSDYWLTQRQGAAFSTTSADAHINASTTISKTTLQNVWSVLNTFAQGFISQASSTIAALHLGTPLEVQSGGTASTSLGGILKGNGTSAVVSAVGGTDYEFPLTFNSPLSRVGNAISCPTCGMGAGFPFTVTGYGVSTSTTVGFTNGIISTASSTFTGPVTMATTTTGWLNGVIAVTGWPYAQTSTGVQQAINACSASLCGGVYLPKAIYTWTSRVTPKNYVHVFGAGKGLTVLQGYVAGDWNFYYSSSTAPLVNFGLSDLTIDLQFGSNASGFRVDNSSSTIIERVAFTNGAAGGWFLHFGPSTFTDTTVINNDNKIIDVDFTNHSGSLEALLLSNARNTQIVRPRLENITSPGIGLWQADYDTEITDVFCVNSSGHWMYYSISVDRAIVSNPQIENCGGIQGANISDNGTFGLTQANDIQIINPQFRGGASTTQSVAIQLGAVNNASIIGGAISKYQIAIALDDGNSYASSSPTNWTISGTHLYDNNASADVHSLHPAIFINPNLNTCFNGSITNNQIYNSTTTTNQRYPIVFDGAATYDCIHINNNRLSAATTTGGTSIGLFDSAALGSNVVIHSNFDYSGTNPAQSAWGVSEGGTGATTFGQGWLYSSGGTTALAASTSPTFNYFFATSTSQASSIAYRLGISETNPQAQIHITDGSSAAIRFEKTGGNAGTFQIYNDGFANIVGPGSSPNRRFAFYDQMGAGASATATPPFTNFNDTNTGINFPDNNDTLAFVTGGSERARFNSSGFFGIGTTSPFASLGVAGQVYASYYTATSTVFANTFPYASSTALTATTLCLTGDTCRTTWPVSGGGGTWPFTPSSYAGVANQSTTTPLWLKDTQIIASTTLFTFASTTQLTNSGATWLTSLTSALLSTDENGQIVATTSIGTNYLTGVLGIANGGTATSTQVTNGINYFDGTKITSGTQLVFNGTNVGIGSSTPMAKLVVAGNIYQTWSNRELYVSYFGNLYKMGFQTDAANRILYVVNRDSDGTAGRQSIQIQTGATPTTRMTVTSDGMVAIGTTTPAFGTLTIGSTSSPQLLLTDNNSSSVPWTLRSTANGLFFATSTALATSSVSAFSIDSTSGVPTFSVLSAANCDVKATAGVLSCGTDATGGSGAWPFTADTYNGVAVQSTTTGLWLKNINIIASSTIFTTASTTQLTNSGATWLTSITNGILSTDSAGKVVATTSIGTNYLAGTISNAQLANSSVNFTYQGNMTGGASVALGSTLTVNASTSPGVGFINATSTTAINSFAGRFFTGTSTANIGQLVVGTSTGSQLLLSDNTASDAMWAVRSIGNMLYFATTTGTATSSLPAMSLDGSGSASLFVGTTTNGAATNGSIAFVGKMFASGLTNSNTGNYVCFNTVGNEIGQHATACSLSSIRWKENIRPIDGGLARIMKLNPIIYDLKPQYGTSKDQPGFIAEEALKATPLLVSYGTDGLPSGYDYPKLTAYLVKAIQEQQAQIDRLGGRANKSAQENWRWIVISILALCIMGQQIQIRRIKKRL